MAGDASQHVRRVRVVTPVYFDVPSFNELRRRILSVLAADPKRAGWRVEFTVIDDSAGRDELVAGLSELPDVRVIVPPFNLGHQRAIVYGVRATLAELDDDDVIVTLDADGEDRPEDIPAILDALEAGGSHKIVLARRTKRHEAPLFKVMYACYGLLFRILTGKVIRTGNYGAYTAALGRGVIAHPYFNLCYSSSFISLETPVIYVPCERGQRYAGESRMGYSRLLMHGLSMLMPFLDRIALRALIAFSVTMIVGVTLSVVVVCVRLFTSSAVPGWATYTLLLLLTISFIALGNFVLLFAIFSQSRGSALAGLEHPAAR
jgi:glycosyltransferase involved in cell wall biosynthesis